MNKELNKFIAETANSLHKAMEKETEENLLTSIIDIYESDYTFREYYHILEEFLEIIETKDTLVIFEIKNNVQNTLFARKRCCKAANFFSASCASFAHSAAFLISKY